MPGDSDHGHGGAGRRRALITVNFLHGKRRGRRAPARNAGPRPRHTTEERRYIGMVEHLGVRVLLKQLSSAVSSSTMASSVAARVRTSA